MAQLIAMFKTLKIKNAIKKMESHYWFLSCSAVVRENCEKDSNPSTTLWTFIPLTYAVSQFTRREQEENKTVLIYQKPHVKN